MTLTAFMDYNVLPERFWAKVVQTGDCWSWTGQLCLGYGRFWWNGATRGAHCVAYEELRGPIPEGLQIDHLCRKRHCVNPYHMEPVSIGENVLRGEGITAVHARKTHCVNGHPFNDANTYFREQDSARQCRVCSSERMRRYRSQRRAAGVAR